MSAGKSYVLAVDNTAGYLFYGAQPMVQVRQTHAEVAPENEHLVVFLFKVSVQ